MPISAIIALTFLPVVLFVAYLIAVYRKSRSWTSAIFSALVISALLYPLAKLLDFVPALLFGPSIPAFLIIDPIVWILLYGAAYRWKIFWIKNVRNPATIGSTRRTWSLVAGIGILVIVGYLIVNAEIEKNKPIVSHSDSATGVTVAVSDLPSMQTPSGWTKKVAIDTDRIAEVSYSTGHMTGFPSAPAAAISIEAMPGDELDRTPEESADSDKREENFVKSAITVDGVHGFETEWDNTIVSLTFHHKIIHLLKDGKSFEIHASSLKSEWPIYEPTVDAAFATLKFP